MSFAMAFSKSRSLYPLSNIRKSSLYGSFNTLAAFCFDMLSWHLVYATKVIYFFQNILNSQYDFKDYYPRIFYHCFIFCFLELALLIQVWQHWPR